MRTPRPAARAPTIMWAGYSDGRLHLIEFNDVLGFHKQPAIFATKFAALARYEDVRKVCITLLPHRKRRGR